MGGLIEIQIVGTYSNGNAGGGITKIFALLTNPGNNIYTNESRVTEAIGNIVDHFSIGEFQWDSTNSTYRIPISHIVSSGNPVYVRIRALAPGTGPTIFDSTYLSSAYTLTALSKNYENFNSPVGIGNKSPGYALDVSGVIRSTTGAYLATSSGNVGIGTTSPASKLTIYEGDIRLYKNHVNGSTGTWLANINFTDEVDRLGARITGERTAWDGAPMGLGFDTGGVGSVTRRMTITSGGNVGIGTTSPAYLLDVAGTIRATGDVIAYSDARVKDNVKTITDALTKVTSLRGVSYTRNDSEDKSEKVGVIAQEVLEILPQVVQQDTEGNYSVAYGNIVGVLIEAIKELKAEIDILKQK
jgi:hypothetical protein